MINDEIDPALAKPVKKASWQLLLEELNAKYCVVQEGGRVYVHHFERHEHRGHVRQVSTFMTFAEFRNLLLNRTIKYGRKRVRAGDFWLEHPKRRQYAGLVFEPGGAEVIAGRAQSMEGLALRAKARRLVTDAAAHHGGAGSRQRGTGQLYPELDGLGRAAPG